MGNLVPAIFWLPLTLSGVGLILWTRQALGIGFWILLAGQVSTWIALNFTGLWDNGAMRRALYKEFQILKPNYRGWKMFVGYATGPYSSWLDPHEDIGYCCLTGETLEFYGDARVRTVQRADVKRVHWRPNVHTLLGLGRWIVVETVENGKPVVYKFEPRDKDTLLGNLIAGRRLRQRLENWLNSERPRGNHPRGR